MALTDVLILRGRSTPSGAETFDAFAARTLDSSFRIASMIVGDATNAEEATHDAYVAAAKRWRGLRRPEGRDAWFGRLLVKACRDRARRGGRTEILDISDQLVRAHRGVGADAVLDREAVSFEARDATARAFAKLGLDHRVTLVLRYGADLEVPQIAEWTGASERVVTGRIREGLRAIRVSQPSPESTIAA
jgi:RNA polymerase sigma factor (sigma-70 family)